MNLRKVIDKLLLRANIAELKTVAAIMKINLDEKEDLYLRQLLRILRTHVDKVKDLLVISGIKQILFEMMQANQAAQQSKDNQNGTGAVGKGNVAADILGFVGTGSEISAFHKDFKIRGAIGEANQKDKLLYASLLKQIEEGKTRAIQTKRLRMQL